MLDRRCEHVSEGELFAPSICRAAPAIFCTLSVPTASVSRLQETALKPKFVNTIITDMSTNVQKTITGRELRRGAPEEKLRPGESVLVEKKSGKLFELRRVDASPKSIVAAVDRIIQEVPLEGRRVKTNLVKIFLEDRE